MAARSFRRMKPDEVEALLARTACAAGQGRFERYKTTHDFDSTCAYPSGSNEHPLGVLTWKA